MADAHTSMQLKNHQNMKSVAKISKAILFALQIGLSIPFYSCNFLSEPEPFVNNTAHPPVTKLYTINEYPANQKFAGTIALSFSSEIQVSKIDHISLFIDTILIGTKSVSPFSFSITTNNWSNGVHTLTWNVYAKEDSLGLLRLSKSPAYVYTSSIHIDNSPPSAPENILVIHDGNHPRIIWTPTAITNFYSYVLQRDGEIIATLSSQSDSTYVDTSYFFADFDRSSTGYSIGVSTTGSTVYSPVYSISSGSSLGLNNVTGTQDGFGSNVIFQSQKLISVSTQTAGTVAQNDNAFCKTMSKSLDGTRLFLWNYIDQYIFSINTLTQLNQSHLGFVSYASNFVVGVGDRIYAVSGSGMYIVREGSVYTKDNLFASPNSPISISPDGSTILAADKKGIKRFTVSSTFEGEFITLALQSPQEDSIGICHVDWNTSRIFVKRKEKIVEAWDNQTLTSVLSFQLSSSFPSVTGVTAIKANSKNLYVAYSVRLNNSDATLLVEYAKNTAQQLRSWTFSSVVRSILASDNGRYLFACTSNHQWIVDIGGVR